MIHNMTGGGGLKLKVVGGTTQPTNPAENTVWVSTDTEISGYAFSATEPENPAEGFVWITTSTTSTAAMTVDKKNTVILYPAACKQYISGAWVIKTAKTYQGGAWKEWRLYLYNKGDKCTDVTGGWAATDRYRDPARAVPSLTFGSATMNVNLDRTSLGANLENGCVETNFTVDLTNYTKLYFNIPVANFAKDWNNNQLYALLGVAKDGSGIVSFAASVQISAAGIYTVDISMLTGLYVVVINMNQVYGNTAVKQYCNLSASEIFLE